MKAHEIGNCPDCGQQHLGRCGGLPYADRLRSVSLDGTVTFTRTKREYYDREPIDRIFGEDSAEQLEEQTKGLGPAVTDEEGNLWHRDRKHGDWQQVDERTLDQVYLAGDRREAV